MTYADSQPQVTMVPVKRYDVVLSLDDLLTPLLQTASNLRQAGTVGATTDPEMSQHLDRFTDLVTQLKEVVGHINQLDATVLASKPGPPTSTTSQ